MFFPIAGIEANPAVLFLVGTAFGLFMAQVGITGAVLTLPFMVSGLGFSSPNVSPTNLVTNLLAPIGGIAGFRKERRMLWSLGIAAGAGGVLGSFIGPVVRVELLSNPTVFQMVLGALMVVLAAKLLLDTRRMQREKRQWLSIETIEEKLTEVRLRFSGREYSFNPLLVAVIGFFVSVIGTMLGISGAFIIVPVCVLLLGLPIYIVAGAILLYTFITSIAGLLNYMYFLPLIGRQAVTPDWVLGLILGAGLMVGGYISARFVQKRIPQKLLKLGLGVLMLVWGGLYVVGGLL